MKQNKRECSFDIVPKIILNEFYFDYSNPFVRKIIIGFSSESTDKQKIFFQFQSKEMIIGIVQKNILKEVCWMIE